MASDAPEQRRARCASSRWWPAATAWRATTDGRVVFVPGALPGEVVASAWCAPSETSPAARCSRWSTPSPASSRAAVPDAAIGDVAAATGSTSTRQHSSS